ncbi:hypothetical protein PG994_007090 [Apiospora phragmitis]|uniref:Uncharacterized protein n=1 Tax=Apiospora phragmitis TaxID=2905665 RepID=A0ABR1UZW0_9PEZI
MLLLLISTAFLATVLSGLVAAAPLSFRPFNAAACIEAAGMLLHRRDENATAVAVPPPDPCHRRVSEGNSTEEGSLLEGDCTPNAPKYTYEPITAESTTRMLILHNGAYEDELTGDLEIVKLDECPYWQVLSFVEGNKAPNAMHADFAHQLYTFNKASRQKCFDPRDRVFALLGHYSARIGADKRLIMQADYKSPTNDVYRELAIRALTDAKSTFLLNAVEHIGKQHTHPPPISLTGV